MLKILHLDENHPILAQSLAHLGFQNFFDYSSTENEILSEIEHYDGIVIRSRIPLKRDLLERAKRLKFIARVGAGLENIDLDFANEKGIMCYNAPEGNRDAVAEHTLGMLLNLMNHLRRCDAEVRKGVWKREENRGHELMGRTVGIVGYGYMGKAFAQRLQGFGVSTICYDILPNVGNQFAEQVDWHTFTQRADVVSLHIPLTDETTNLVQAKWINPFAKPFYLLNTARGSCVRTTDLLNAIEREQIIGAGLDVLEYEKRSFENLLQEPSENKENSTLQALVAHPKVLLSPHVAGWTVESKKKLAEVLVEKIKRDWV